MDKAARAALLTAKGMDKTSENIADYVADLLRQGRAKEITDDLMAQADPQRLMHHYTTGNTGMDLPMDKASRMARAAQMGFNRELYRGGDESAINANPKRRQTQYYAYEPNIASEYAFNRTDAGGGNHTGAAVGKFKVKAHNRATGDDVLDEYETASGLNRSSLDYNMSWVPLNENYTPAQTVGKIENSLMSKGYDSAFFPDDSAPISGDTHDTLAVFDPATNVRSQFARFDPRLDHLAHLSASTGGAMDFARHVEAVQRAGGQIAPSKYLPNVPRAVHAGGGEVVNLGKEKLVRSITKAASDVKSGAHQERMDQRAYKLHESGHLPLSIGTKVTPPQGWDMPNELHIHGYWQDILHPEQHGYKLKSENGDLYEVQHQMHSGQNPYVFGGGFKAYSGPVRNRAGYSDKAMASRNPILPTRTPEQSDQLNKEYDQLFGTEPDITKAGGGNVEGEDDGITAYHGSPHSFEKFDISKLGTGEGAQAYGHGLYFAGNEKIAKHYRDTLSDNQGMVDAAIKRFGGIDGAIGEMKKVINDYQNGVYADPNGLQSTKKRLEQLERQKSGELNKGHMYKVKLNVKPHELLDWDKPLSEQPHVLNAIGNRYGDPEIVMQQLGNDVNTATGRDLHDALSGMGQDKQLAAKNLQDMGLKGIRYLDAGSRNDTDGDPTHNYVMFHHDPVQVVDKYEYGGRVGKEEGGALGVGNDIQRSRVQELIDKHGGDDQAAKEYLRTSLPSIPASSQDFWQKTLDNFDYLKTPNPVQQVATPVAQENARLGNPEYSTGHAAPHPEKGGMMHDLDAVFPDIATNGRQYYGTGADYDHESFGQISRVNGRPSASVQIYRSVPKDIDKPKINAGDWVTTSPSYAKEHGKAHLGNKYKILKKTVRADELATNGDSIHEWGYWPKTEKADGGAVDAALALTRRFTKDGIGAALALKSKGK